MRKLLAATCLTPLSFALLPAVANAETVISTAITTPVLTSTGNDDVRISSTGSVKPAGGNAVTIDSNDSVKNEGLIQITGANNSAGIVANPGLAGNITNSGTITIDESYTPTDTDNESRYVSSGYRYDVGQSKCPPRIENCRALMMPL